jgi:hypothetical protein
MLAQSHGWTVRGVEQQCLVRDANEVSERANTSLAPGGVRGLLRCECGDPGCSTLVAPTHAEYEAVRARGSHFIITLDHEDPEVAWVLSEDDRYAVIDVVAGDARHAVMVHNPRHAWVAGVPVGRRPPGDTGSRGGSR